MDKTALIANTHENRKWVDSDPVDSVAEGTDFDTKPQKRVLKNKQELKRL